jgi:hypothetical protein
MAVRLSALCAGRVFPLRIIPGTHLCYRLSQTEGRSAVGSGHRNDLYESQIILAADLRYPFIRPSVRLSIYLSNLSNLSIYLPIYLIYLSIYSSIYLSTYLSVCLSIYLSI